MDTIESAIILLGFFGSTIALGLHLAGTGYDSLKR